MGVKIINLKTLKFMKALNWHGENNDHEIHVYLKKKRQMIINMRERRKKRGIEVVNQPYSIGKSIVII